MARDRFKKLGDSIPVKSPQELERQHRDIVIEAEKMYKAQYEEGQWDLEGWDDRNFRVR